MVEKMKALAGWKFKPPLCQVMEVSWLDCCAKKYPLGGFSVEEIVFKVTRVARPRMRDQYYGRLIFTASAAGKYSVRRV